MDQDNNNNPTETEPEPPNQASPPRHSTEVWKGIGLTALLHLLWIVFPLAYFAIGVTQLIYIIPALILCRKNVGIMQGLLIGAGITFLLNAACFGIALGTMQHFTSLT